jgi:hypothetical protein
MESHLSLTQCIASSFAFSIRKLVTATSFIQTANDELTTIDSFLFIYLCFVCSKVSLFFSRKRSSGGFQQNLQLVLALTGAATVNNTGEEGREGREKVRVRDREGRE